MTRVKRGVVVRKRHKKVLKQAKGYWGARHRVYRRAKEAVMHGLQYAYRDRRARKRDFRKLWIARINAVTQAAGMPYSRFMAGLKEAGVVVNRKVLADMAVKDPQGFDELVQLAKKKLRG